MDLPSNRRNTKCLQKRLRGVPLIILRAGALAVRACGNAIGHPCAGILYSRRTQTIIILRRGGFLLAIPCGRFPKINHQWLFGINRQSIYIRRRSLVDLGQLVRRSLEFQYPIAGGGLSPRIWRALSYLIDGPLTWLWSRYSP